MRGYSLAALVENFYDLIYPVGICIDFDNNTNPNNVFQGTTWVQITDGRAIRAATGSTVGGTQGQISSLGGADSVTIGISHLPAHAHSMIHNHGVNINTNLQGAHTHTVSGTAASAGAHTHTIEGKVTGNSSNGVSSGYSTVLNSTPTSSAGAHTHTVSGTAASAGSHTHNVNGTTGGASVSNTGEQGGGNALAILNASHYYARWKRTA